MLFDQDLTFDSERSAKLFAATIKRRSRDLDRAFAIIGTGRADFMQRLEKSIAGSVESGEAKAMLEERIKRMLGRVEALREGKIDRRVAALAQAEDFAALNDKAMQEVIAHAIDEAGGVPRPPREAMGLMTGRKDPEAWLERTGFIGALGYLAPWVTEPDDVGTVQQALGDPVPMVPPPPLGVCSSAPYVDQLTEVS